MAHFFSTAKVQMACFLAVIAVSVILRDGSLTTLGFIALSVATTLVSDAMLTRLRKTPPFILSAAVVSGLIIGLLSSPHAPWLSLILSGVLAMIAKNFIRPGDRHVFNPAAFGLFLSAFVFHRSVTWLAVPGNLIFYLILLLPGIVSAIRLQRYRIMGSFFVVYIALVGLLQLFGHSFDINTIFANTLLNPAMIFFSLVMLPEPMTTPNDHRRQLLFGATVALIAVGISFIPFVFVPDPLLAALLVGNILFFNFR